MSTKLKYDIPTDRCFCGKHFILHAKLGRFKKKNKENFGTTYRVSKVHGN